MVRRAYIGEMHFDDASGKLFSIWQGAPSSVVVVDTETWTIEKCYNSTTSSPKFSRVYDTTNAYRCVTLPGGEEVAISGGNYHVARIDHSTETITEYNFVDNSTFGLVKNVAREDPSGGQMSISDIVLDPVNKRLWIAFIATNGLNDYLEVGYIDTTEQPDPITGYFSWHQLFYDHRVESWWPILSAAGGFVVDPDAGKILISRISFDTPFPSMRGTLFIFSYTTGSQEKYYIESENTGFHLRGIEHPVYYNGKVYGAFPYSTLYDQAERRGLMIIDTATDTVRYSRPTWATKNDYGLVDIQVIDKDSDNPRLIMGTPDGPAIFDINTEVWTLFDSDNVPGLEQENTPYVDYDETNGIIMTGYDRIQAFRESGDFKQVKVYDGTLQGDDSYTYSNLLQMTAYSQATAPAIVTDENDVVWAIWDYINKSG